MKIKEPVMSGIGRVLPFASDHPKTSTVGNHYFEETRTDLKPFDCPKFEPCSAPICPLDVEWRERTYRKGEAVCHFMRMHAKNALQGQKAGSVPEEMVETVVTVFQEICDRYAPLKTSLERAALSRPKGFSLGEER